MSGIRSEMKRIQERNKSISPDYESSGPRYLEFLYFRPASPIVSIVMYILGMYIEPSLEISVKGIGRNGRKVYNSLSNIF